MPRTLERWARLLEQVIAGEVTQAVRESEVDGVKVKADDYIGLVDDRVIVSSPALGKVVETVVSQAAGGATGRCSRSSWAKGRAGSEARRAVEQLRQKLPESRDRRARGRPAVLSGAAGG